MSVLVLIRHGQSQWNLENRFTGWTDVPLTERGKADARKTAEVLHDLCFDHGFTSRLQRASETLRLILEALGQGDIPVTADAALNERDYGELTGLNKAETAEKYGQEKVLLWRRSYATPPPGGESIADVAKRVLPFFQKQILPVVIAGKNVIVTASGNSMRPILQYLDHVDDATTAAMEIGLCTPYVYTFDREKLVGGEVVTVPGIVTLGASQTEKEVRE
jgi:2,3-bisphosphoglycerate-dependent phosphoglycerate mutase